MQFFCSLQQNNSHQIYQNSLAQVQKKINQQVEPTINRVSFAPNAEIIQYYEKQLAYYIGPMASLIIEEILINNSIHSYQELIEALMVNIPDAKQQLEFKHNLV